MKRLLKIEEAKAKERMKNPMQKSASVENNADVYDLKKPPLVENNLFWNPI